MAQTASSFEVESQGEHARASEGRNRSSLISRALSVTAPLPENTASEKDLIINLITGGLGTGILCLPWLTAGASLLPGMLIIVAVLLVNVWTIKILVQAAERFQVFDLGSLLAQLPGRFGAPMQLLSNATVWVSTMICLVSYVIVMSNSLLSLAPGGTPRWPAVLGVAVIVYPLCFLDQSKLAFTSAVTVFVFVYIMALILAKISTDGLKHEACVLGIGEGSIAMVGGMANCIIIQMCILPMYGELKDRTPEKMNRVVQMSFFGLFLLFASFSLGGYLWRGPAVQDNILEHIAGGPLEKLAQIGAAVAVMGVYPILVSPMLAPIRSSAQTANFVQPATAAIVCFSGISALFLDSLGPLSVINGAICAAVFVGILPALVGYFFLRQPAVYMGLLMFGGVLAGILGIVFMDNYATELHCFYFV